MDFLLGPVMALGRAPRRLVSHAMSWLAGTAPAATSRVVAPAAPTPVRPVNADRQPHFQMCELPLDFEPPEFRIQWASGPWMQRQALALRQQVFCSEQGLFPAGNDVDAIDDLPSTRLLVACSSLAGQPDEVVGTVRIHEAASGQWWGSRLAVAPAWRNHGLLGSTLIRLAVSSACAQGCTEFWAHVQVQNVPLFRRLHWQLAGEASLQGRPHALMRADLTRYPPCDTPYTGYVLARGRRH